MRMLWPNLADMVFAVLAGQMADAVANSGRLSRVATRRAFSTVGFVGTGLSLFLAGRAQSPLAVTALVTLASGMQACHAGGFKASYTEISKEASGLIMGIGNTFASAGATFVPLAGTAILEANGGVKELEAWQALFGVVLTVGALGAAAYSLLLCTDWCTAFMPRRRPLPGLLGTPQPAGRPKACDRQGALASPQLRTRASKSASRRPSLIALTCTGFAVICNVQKKGPQTLPGWTAHGKHQLTQSTQTIEGDVLASRARRVPRRGR